MTVTPEVVAALERLQLEALETQISADADLRHVEQAVALARAHGFEPLGVGSTRLAVALDGGLVAKIAYGAPGLLLNLQEATFWLVFPPSIRRHLTPCVLLSPALVVVFERVEVVGPSLVEALDRDEDEVQEEQVFALARYADHFERLRAATGFPASLPIRLDNYGVRNGQLVAIDYGQKWPPVEAAWAWTLARLEAGPLALEQGSAELWDWLSGWIAGRESIPREFGEPPTLRSLARRAGIVAADPLSCECASLIEPEQRCGECPDDCAMTTDAASAAAALALHTSYPSGREGIRGLGRAFAHRQRGWR